MKKTAVFIRSATQSLAKGMARKTPKAAAEADVGRQAEEQAVGPGGNEVFLAEQFQAVGRRLQPAEAPATRVGPQPVLDPRRHLPLHPDKVATEIMTPSTTASRAPGRPRRRRSSAVVGSSLVKATIQSAMAAVHRSISPSTRSSEPTTAGTSAMRQPRHKFGRDREVAEAAAPHPHPPGHRRAVADDHEAHLALGRLGFQVDLALGQFLPQLDRLAAITRPRGGTCPSPGGPVSPTAPLPASARRSGASCRPAPPGAAPADRDSPADSGR